MNGTPNYPVTQALAALVRAAQTLPDTTPSTDDLVLTLVDLSCIAVRVGELAEQLRMLLADRPTVTAHLQQGQSYASDLGRTFDHAAGTLAYNTDRALPVVSVAVEKSPLMARVRSPLLLR